MNNNITDITIKDYVSKAYTIFGSYVNNHRAFPGLYDGLKPVYRRVIFSLINDFNNNNTTKSLRLMGEVTKYHPHGDASVKPVVSKLVNYGIFKGQGNHGYKSILGNHLSAAAPRYTEVMINPDYCNIIKPVLGNVRYLTSEVDGQYSEPEYIPTPIPLGLVFDGYFGLGIGAQNRLPSFSFRSLYEAYINNDPKLLKYRGKLNIDYNESELDQLWATGSGRVTYYYDMVVHQRSLIISGDPHVFPIKLPDEVELLRGAGRITINDNSDATKDEIEISINAGMRISIQEVAEMMKPAIKYKKMYSIKVTNGTKISQIGIKDWIDTTYNNYKNLRSTNISNSINSLTHQYKVYELLPKFALVYLPNPEQSDDELATKLGVDKSLVSECLSKTLRTIRKQNQLDKLNEITSKINELKSINIDAEINNNIK